uniref:Uncharacterized protein n=1 Tax=Rhizophora mucronata TaxID=61149 RepID=A0A2P2PM74_RHIMU
MIPSNLIWIEDGDTIAIWCDLPWVDKVMKPTN